MKGLLKEKIIVKDEEKRYYFTTELENTTLKALGSAQTVIHSLDGFAEMLAVSTDPFPKGIEKIFEVVRLKMILQIERYAVPKLTPRDKLEFDIYFDVLDMTLEWIFKILKKKSKSKTNIVKIKLISSLAGKTK